MDFAIPTYNKVFIETDEYDDLLPVFKLALTNSVIYRAFKLCKENNANDYLNKLNETKIVCILKGINKKISLCVY